MLSHIDPGAETEAEFILTLTMTDEVMSDRSHSKLTTASANLLCRLILMRLFILALTEIQIHAYQ